MRRSRTTQVLAIAAAATAIAGLSLSSNAAAVTAAADTPGSTVTTDSRSGALAGPTQAQADAVSAILKASPGTRATWDARFGTPRTALTHRPEPRGGPTP